MDVMVPSGYHQRVAVAKRAAIIRAATTLFTARGFDKVSLAQVAGTAEVSKATLFRQFPTKAALFDAVVDDVWKRDAPDVGDLDAADPANSLRHLGSTYADLLGRDDMAGLFRLVIAESRSFPELGQRQFDLGKLPFYVQVRTFLTQATVAGSLAVDRPDTAATQFLGMIASYVLWPRLLLPDWKVSPGDVRQEVEQAVLTTLERWRV